MLYDTGCFDYENDGIDQNQNGIIDDFTNGLDDNGIGGVDDLTEVEGPTPYPVPLKGIQIRIRVFDPDSRQIREVTVTEDFLFEQGSGFRGRKGPEVRGRRSGKTDEGARARQGEGATGRHGEGETRSTEPERKSKCKMQK